jgi:TonB-dependent receptor
MDITKITRNSQILLFVLICFPFIASGQTGTLRGNISDENGAPVPGATVYISNVSKGTISDVNGNYRLLNIPSGNQEVSISFISYAKEVHEVEIIPRRVVVLDVNLKEKAMELDAVAVYGQAQGQQAAINQQLNAPGVVNVISGQKLRELPDVNVAESLGRLPGVMAARSGGEGQKVIIRGLEPKYNSVSVGGVNLPSTGGNDRSFNLGLISNEILGGVEVQKANTADQDAEGLGGTVNLTLKEAPAGFKVRADMATGYNSLSRNINNYKAAVNLSNRFLENKMGIMLVGNFDYDHRESDRLSASYDVSTRPLREGEKFIRPHMNSLSIEAYLQERYRTGASLLFDWKVHPSTVIKFNNFFSFRNQTGYNRSKDYEIFDFIRYTQREDRSSQYLLSNALEMEHYFLNTILDWGVNRSVTKGETPYRHRVRFFLASGWNTGEEYNYEFAAPELLPNPLNLTDNAFNLEEYYFYDGRFRPDHSMETEASAFLNWEIPFRLGSSVSGYIKTGSKVRRKSREREQDEYHSRIDSYGSEIHNAYMEQYPETQLTSVAGGHVGGISFVNYMDPNPINRDFMGGRYEYLNITEVLDYEIMSRHYDEFLQNWYELKPEAKQDDYNAEEVIWGNYLMSEVRFGKYVTFIPGVRFENTFTLYDGYIAQNVELYEETDLETFFQDTTASNNYLHILPQIHLKISPTSWFDIRLAYTNTISRADYSRLIPKLIINTNDDHVSMGDTELKPALSENFDVIMSFYKPKIGLFTMGVFHKNIDNFIYHRFAYILENTDDTQSTTDPDDLGLPPIVTSGWTIDYPVNNPHRATITGFELDLQSNLLFLPVKGFVFNVNFSYMKSQTNYMDTKLGRIPNPDPSNGLGRFIRTNIDTAHTDRLLKQPVYLANVGLGYDNKKIGLSARLSFSYQDDILNNAPKRNDKADREETLAYYRYDFQASQRLYKKLFMYFNVANIFNQPDRIVRAVTGYYTNLEYYGARFQLGLRYKFE